MMNAAHISRLENGKSVLSRKSARNLDSKYGNTSIGIGWFELLERYRQGSRSVSNAVSGAQREYDLFLASPMAAFSNDDAYREENKTARDVSDGFEQYCGLSVYYAGYDISSTEDFELGSLQPGRNSSALDDSKYFVLLLLDSSSQRPSSVWVETGYALAKRKPALLLAPRPDILPFMLETISQHRLPDLLPPVLYRPVSTVKQALALVRRNGRALLDQLDQLAEG